MRTTTLEHESVLAGLRRSEYRAHLTVSEAYPADSLQAPVRASVRRVAEFATVGDGRRREYPHSAHSAKRGNESGGGGP